MDERGKYLSVVMPALNEEKSIASAVNDVLLAFKQFDIDGEIIAINDGSNDSTPLLIKRLAQENPYLIKMVNHITPKGIGASFWDGVDSARGDLVCMLPADNENDPRETFRYLKLFEDVDMVIPFTLNKDVRSLSRNIISFVYRFIINATFLTSFNYTNGIVIYRRELLKELSYRCDSFFFQADILIRLVKRGYLFAEVPYRLRKRKSGKSKAISLPSLREVARDYIRLALDIYFKRTEIRKGFYPGSVSIKRYSEI